MAPWLVSHFLPDRSAQWIWSRSGAATSAPSNYLVTCTKSVPLTERREVEFVGAVDSYAEVYVNGVRMGRMMQGWPASGTRGIQWLVGNVQAGLNTITVVCDNLDGGSAGLLLSIRTVGGTVLAKTDDTWDCSETIKPTPSIACKQVPGFTSIPDVDRDLDDIGFFGQDAARVCTATPDCLGFNTNGWVKRSSAPLIPSRGSCMYVRNRNFTAAPVEVLGSYDAYPWGISGTVSFSVFDPTAKIVWSSPSASWLPWPAALRPTFHKVVNVTAPTNVTMAVMADDYCDVFVNGAYIDWLEGGWEGDFQYLHAALKVTVNVVSLRCENRFAFRYGFAAGLTVAIFEDSGKVLARTDASWSYTQELALADTGATAATVLGSWNMGPWKMTAFPDPFAKWIWGSADAHKGVTPADSCYTFHRIYTADSESDLVGVAYGAAEDWCHIYLNGAFTGALQKGWPKSATVLPLVFKPQTANLLQLRCCASAAVASTMPPAGVLLTVVKAIDSKKVLLRTDASWKWADKDYLPDG